MDEEEGILWFEAEPWEDDWQFRGFGSKEEMIKADLDNCTDYPQEAVEKIYLKKKNDYTQEDSEEL